MELHLGLAPPTNPSKGLDLNSCAYETKGLFSSFPWNHDSYNFHKKRSFTQLFEHADTNNREVLLPTLSLLPLTPGHSNDDDDPEEEDNHRNSSAITKNDGDDVEARVGWPPINSWRKKIRYDNYGDEAARNDRMVWIDHHHQQQHHDYGSVGLRGSNTLYVKVKMEGVGIARKVDLSMHHSFQTLKETLMDMFGKCGHQHSNCYELAYQDKEGDWLLAEDVPWRSFIQCAQRLKLLKSSG